MSEFEGHSQEPRLEKQALELPPIKKGVTDEIFLESIIDRQGFLKKTAGFMKRENPHLLKYIVDNTISSLVSEDLVTWTFGYYEIYARSAREKGLLMVRVEEDSILARESENERKQEITLKVDVESEIFNNMLLEEAQEEQKIEDESEENDDLAHYWYQLSQFSGNLPEGEDVLLEDTVAEVGRFLHKQVETNVFREEFMPE